MSDVLEHTLNNLSASSSSFSDGNVVSGLVIASLLNVSNGVFHSSLSVNRFIKVYISFLVYTNFWKWHFRSAGSLTISENFV